MDLLLRAAWHASIGPHPQAPRHLEALAERYRDPRRTYHGIAHLRQVVRDVSQAAVGVDGVALGLVRIAAFYHDAVYEPGGTGNERASARLAGEHLRALGWPEAPVVEVERLVLSTEAHDAGDPNAVVLADADLAVLGALPAAYAAYAEGVRAEYRHVDDEAWRAGRSAVLRAMLGRPRLYRTPAMEPREARARANIASELAALSRRATSPPSS